MSPRPSPSPSPRPRPTPAAGRGLPVHRPRRLRQSAPVRRLVAQTRLHPAELVLPVFVKEGASRPAPISSMPGVVQHSADSLVQAAREAADLGVGGIMVFGVPTTKDEIGSGADDPDGILNAALARLSDEVGDRMVVMADLCLDEFTSHGHCGVLDERGRVDNDATLERYAQMALAQARAGATVLGASGMMDGQIAYVRTALDEAGYTDTILLAYAAKYTSALYGPFRDAVESSLESDRAAYQQDPANLTESLREIDLDLAEGADIVMVKPAQPHLDVIRAAAEISSVPVAAYQISGEYSQIEAAAANGWIDRERTLMESLLHIRRAGAQIILTYYAVEAARLLGGRPD